MVRDAHDLRGHGEHGELLVTRMTYEATESMESYYKAKASHSRRRSRGKGKRRSKSAAAQNTANA